MGVDPDIFPLLEEKQKQINELNQTVTEQSQQIAGLAESNRDILLGMQDIKDRLRLLENSSTPEPSAQTLTFPGDPGAGKIRWGCSYMSNGIPTPHETAAGVPVGVRRTFWRLDQASSLISACKADHTAGRLPWVSIKLTNINKVSVSWKNTAAGQLDNELIALIKSLGSLQKPVWFSVHHEPEGGNGTAYPDEGQGTEPDWRAMQTHIRQLLNASGVKNVAFAPILMAWTWDTRSGRNPADYWVDGIWDFMGIDHYVEASSTTQKTQMWLNTLAFCKQKNIRIAIGEWGNKDHTASGAAEMQEWYNHLIEIGSPGSCYFDTNLNGGVPLSGDALIKFRQLMVDPKSVTL
jgi:hypothetical protein